MINNNNLTNNLYIIGFDRKPSELYNLIILYNNNQRLRNNLMFKK